MKKKSTRFESYYNPTNFGRTRFLESRLYLYKLLMELFQKKDHFFTRDLINVVLQDGKKDSSVYYSYPKKLTAEGYLTEHFIQVGKRRFYYYKIKKKDL